MHEFATRFGEGIDYGYHRNVGCATGARVDEEERAMPTTFQKSDAEIVEQIVQELRWDCRTETSPIRVFVTDGVATLTGQVKYYAFKHAAEEAAHRIAGVVSVQDNIEVKVPFTEYRGNCEIAEAVTRAFEWNVLVPSEQISVLVNNGIVNLSGIVNCLSQREEAERAVINLLGVRGIVNEVIVQARPIAVETVCADIQNTLERQAVAEKSKVTVDVDQGSLRLSGTVPSWNQRCAVISAAGFAHGVQQIIDDLQIAPVLRTA
jgi:osmotically-inducible protein OsmY